jgi:large subunit ribosomal protein L13
MAKFQINRKTHQIDATKKILGRLGCEVALLLRGKHKVNFTPNIDNGDIVIVSNIDKIQMSGKKLEQKKLYGHSGYPGGLKVEKLSKMFKERPEKILQRAVWKMLPKNKFRSIMFKRLRFKK